MTSRLDGFGYPQGMLSTGLSMGYKEYQGKANYDFVDYTVALIGSGLDIR